MGAVEVRFPPAVQILVRRHAEGAFEGFGESGPADPADLREFLERRLRARIGGDEFERGANQCPVFSHTFVGGRSLQREAKLSDHFQRRGVQQEGVASPFVDA